MVETLTSSKLIESKFSEPPRGYSWLRNKKLYRASLSRAQTNWKQRSYVDLKGATRISVLNSPWLQNRPWRQPNYSRGIFSTSHLSVIST